MYIVYIVYGVSIESQFSANSSSFPSTAGKTAAAFMSVSLTYPSKLHTPTHTVREHMSIEQIGDYVHVRAGASPG